MEGAEWLSVPTFTGVVWWVGGSGWWRGQDGGEGLDGGSDVDHRRGVQRLKKGENPGVRLRVKQQLYKGICMYFFLFVFYYLCFLMTVFKSESLY